MSRALPQAPPAPAGSLAAALAAVPDPRRPYGWRPAYAPVPLVALLQGAVAAMLCGARSLYAIAQWVRERAEDEPALLAALGFPPGRSACVATLHRVFRALDVAAFERAVGDWLRTTGVAPTDPLALDGKTLRGSGVYGHHGEVLPAVHLVAAYAHEAQAVLAQLRGRRHGDELPTAHAVLDAVPLPGRVVTGDALLTQRDVCQQILDAGGDYVLPVKANQPALRESLAQAFSPLAAERPRRARRPARPACHAGVGAAGRRALVVGGRAGAQVAARAARGPAPLGRGRSLRGPLCRRARRGRRALAGAAAGLPA